MRGNSANMARHVMCPSLNKRVAITFFKLKPDSSCKAQPPLTMNHVTLWRQGTPAPPVLNPFSMVRAPLVMLAPAPKRLDAGTGVFLPWTPPPVSRKPTKHLPPRVQRLRLLSSAAKSVADREASSSPEIGVIWVGKCHTRYLRSQQSFFSFFWDFLDIVYFKFGVFFLFIPNLFFRLPNFTTLLCYISCYDSQGTSELFELKYAPHLPQVSKIFSFNQVNKKLAQICVYKNILATAFTLPKGAWRRNQTFWFFFFWNI